MPALDTEAVRAYWENAGFVALEVPDDPLAQIALTSDALTLTLHRPRAIAAPVLVFADPLMPARLEALAGSGIVGSAELPQGSIPAPTPCSKRPRARCCCLLQAEG